MLLLRSPGPSPGTGGQGMAAGARAPEGPKRQRRAAAHRLFAREAPARRPECPAGEKGDAAPLRARASHSHRRICPGWLRACRNAKDGKGLLSASWYRRDMRPAITAALFLFALPAAAQDIGGPARAADGDPLDLSGVSVWLLGVDVPEMVQRIRPVERSGKAKEQRQI